MQKHTVDLNDVNLENVDLNIYSQWECHYIYDLKIDNQIIGQVEVQFDDGEFNGNIIYTDINSEDENGEFEWQEMKNKELFEFIKERAIKDYAA